MGKIGSVSATQFTELWDAVPLRLLVMRPHEIERMLLCGNPWKFYISERHGYRLTSGASDAE